MTRFTRLLRPVLGLWLILCAVPVMAQTFPKFDGLVVDAAGKIDPATKAQLEQKLEALQKDTGRQLVVATIPDLQGYPIEDYGYRLGRAWGVGLKNADNGAILFVAPNEGKGQRGPRLEVGRGLVPLLPDAWSSQMIRTLMLPRLRESSDISGALNAGADAVIAQLRASPEEAQAKVAEAANPFDRQHRRGGGDSNGFPILIVLVIFIGGFVVLAIMRRKQGQRFHDDDDDDRGGGGGGRRWRLADHPLGPRLGQWWQRRQRLEFRRIVGRGQRRVVVRRRLYRRRRRRFWRRRRIGGLVRC